MLHDFDPPLQFCVNEARAVLFRLPYSGLLLIATAGMNCHRALGVPHGRSGLARTARLEPAVQAKPHGANDFDALVDALISNTAYANIHTTSSPTPPAPDTAFPAGEIRGQVHRIDRENQGNQGNQ
jgi:hypothetical protein